VNTAPQAAQETPVRRVEAGDPLLGEALEAARDYRGDVTIELVDGGLVEGFLYDRSAGTHAAARKVRLLPKDGGPRQSIAEDRIRSLAFTGKDAAAGKTWENWVRRYAEKRLKGEAASIESETLD
jgi:hypothetical protein